MLFGGGVVVVENIKDSLRVVLLLLFADVRDREQFGPGVWHARELSGAGIKTDVDRVFEVGWIRDVGFVRLLVPFSRLVTFVLLLLRLRFLGERPHVHRHNSLCPGGGEPDRWGRRLILVIRHAEGWEGVAECTQFGGLCSHPKQ